MKKKDLKILIVGEGLNGKDTLAELITTHLGYKFRGSSQVAAKEVVYPLLENFYSSVEECFEDRRNNRGLWKVLICAYNRKDKTALARLVTEGGYGYTGLRDWEEVVDCINQRLFDVVVWIERPDISQKDSTLNFGYEEISDLCYEHNIPLAYVENNSIQGLEELVKVRLKHWLENLDKYHKYFKSE